MGREEHIMELREGRLPPPVAQAKPIDVTATTITFEIIGPAFEPGLPIKCNLLLHILPQKDCLQIILFLHYSIHCTV